MFEWAEETSAVLTARANRADTHRDATVVHQDLQHRVVLVGVQRCQVEQGAGHGAVNPLGEFTGEVFGGTVVELTLEDV